MLDIGFSELLLIAVVGLIFIGPKDLPVVVRHVAKFLRELRGLYSGIKKQVNGLMEEAGIDEFRKNVTTIIDMDGKPQRAYDVRELESLKAGPSGDAGTPLPAGEATRLSERSELSRSLSAEARRAKGDGEGASTQALAQPHPHPDLQPIAPRGDWANPTSPAGEVSPAAPLAPKANP